MEPPFVTSFIQSSVTAISTTNIQSRSTVMLQQTLLAANVPAAFAVFLLLLLYFFCRLETIMIVIDLKSIRCHNVRI